MFYAREFVYDGVSSEMYGLMIYDLDSNAQEDVSFGNRAEIMETRTWGRIQPLHYGVNYHTQPLEFRVIFGAERALDRYELEDVALWLTGSQEYKWLQICQPDMGDINFRCIFTEVRPLSVSWLQVAFEATIRCDCPYAYGYPFKAEYQISGTRDILFRNESSVSEYLRPLLTFTPSGSGSASLSLVNLSDSNREFRIDSMPAGSIPEIDNNNGIIRDTGAGQHNLYSGFNLNFFRLVHGDNRIRVTGSGLLTIQGRFLYNVAA